MSVGVSALFAFALVACNSSSQVKESHAPILVMGLSADYPPFEFKKNGEVVGLDIDIAREVAQEMGATLSIEDMDFSGLIPAMHSGRIDFIMSGLTITDDRKKNVDFSDIYFTSSFALIIPQESSLSKIEEFQGKKLGAQLGTTMEKFLKDLASAQYRNLKVVALGKNPVLIQELKSGRLDGIVVEEAQAASFVKANPSLKQVLLAGAQGDGYAVAFAKNSPKAEQIKKKFNEVIAKLKSSKKMDELKLKWLGT